MKSKGRSIFATTSRMEQFVIIVNSCKPNGYQLQMDINYTTKEIPNTIDGKEIEVLIIALIETLNRQKSKCGKDEVFKLVKDTI